MICMNCRFNKLSISADGQLSKMCFNKPFLSIFVCNQLQLNVMFTIHYHILNKNESIFRFKLFCRIFITDKSLVFNICYFVVVF